ncbi:hypothetical protein B5E53_18140 [Eubacterium sp. An11]|uniref:tetratricopeptide repeat protein n=1 Tax=Eubacterium sp. An11 TaxID=1965542 RepID=UPI000B367574|nr:tetratricopeptide repeat protein [Eubacterium sp. An11]OUQ62164.1 hypothetical protein B5E53_18140 [Eubacterium sp. An11]
MKEYFKKDYWEKIQIDGQDIKQLRTITNYELFLKVAYDKADEIFDRRFSERENQNDKNTDGTTDKISEKNKGKGKISKKVIQLKNLIQVIEDKIEENNHQGEHQKLAALTLGNAYFRLAWCQEEIFKGSNKMYKKSASYFNCQINSENNTNDDIDLLLKLNKGKYFRNTARIGKRSLYEKTVVIFEDVANTVFNLSITPEKKIHIYLDALINIGRAKRYYYQFDESTKIFCAIIYVLKKHIDVDIQKTLDDSTILNNIIANNNGNSEATLLETIISEDSSIDSNIIFYKEYVIQALIHIGIILRKDKKYDKAEQIFHLVTEIDKDNIDAKNNLGVCYRKTKGKHGKAEEIFGELNKKGNKFAYVNLCKCYLMRKDDKYYNCFSELKEQCKKGKSMQLYLILGAYYQKEENYEKAIEMYQKVYNANPYIARGCIGFKALYNISQCFIKQNNFAQARKILNYIRDVLQKQKNEPDTMVEIDYGWCLMQEGNNTEALQVYKKAKIDNEKNPEKTGQRNWMRILNNLAECYIRTNDVAKAIRTLDQVATIEKRNRWALYLRNVINLNEIIDNKNMDVALFEKVYKDFSVLAQLSPAQSLEQSGWVISACLLYDKYDALNMENDKNKIKEEIIRKLKYQTEKITLKSFYYLAKFLKKVLEKNNWENKEKDVLFRCFCHMNLMEERESQNITQLEHKKGTFTELMEGPNLHFIERKDRAQILADIVIMYKNILDIKNKCCHTNKKEYPVHYTKLSTLKSLLKEPGENQDTPKLRLWNTAYMNDSYEGKVFGDLLNKFVVQDTKHQMLEKSENNVLDTLQYFFESTSQNVADSMVYIISFSEEINNFQMWNIYADLEKGCAIRFNNDFFDIKEEYSDPIEDLGNNAYALYRVQYYDLKKDSSVSDKENKFKKSMLNIWNCINQIKTTLKEIEGKIDQENGIGKKLFKNAETEIRAFVADRLNEIRFLFKDWTYEYEKELRLIRSSRFPKIDEENFEIPKLYIDVEREISDLEVTLGKKIEEETVKDLNVWLSRTGKVKTVHNLKERELEK